MSKRSFEVFAFFFLSFRIKKYVKDASSEIIFEAGMKDLLCFLLVVVFLVTFPQWYKANSPSILSPISLMWPLRPFSIIILLLIFSTLPVYKTWKMLQNVCVQKGMVNQRKGKKHQKQSSQVGEKWHQWRGSPEIGNKQTDKKQQKFVFYNKREGRACGQMYKQVVVLMVERCSSLLTASIFSSQ